MILPTLLAMVFSSRSPAQVEPIPGFVDCMEIRQVLLDSVVSLPLHQIDEITQRCLESWSQ